MTTKITCLENNKILPSYTPCIQEWYVSKLADNVPWKQKKGEQPGNSVSWDFYKCSAIFFCDQKFILEVCAYYRNVLWQELIFPLSLFRALVGWRLWQRYKIVLLLLKTPVYCYQWFKTTPQTSVTADEGLSPWGWEIALRKLSFDLKQMAWKGSLSPLAGR